MTGPRVVGIDFDNTIISYDELMYTVAVARGLIAPAAGKVKKEIRDQIRLLADGDIHWQRIQAYAYGPGIGAAILIPGVSDFIRECRRRRDQVYIISHKTDLAGYDETGTNLREAALGWMQAHRFFDANGLGLSESHVLFGRTRREKVERIRSLGCTHFIDDLEETYLEPSFPTHVNKVLYNPGDLPVRIGHVTVCRSWSEIGGHFFGVG